MRGELLNTSTFPPLLALFLIAGVLVVSGCSQSTEPEETAEPGVLAFYQDPILVEIPDTVTRSVPFVVSVRTYGDGGCVRQGFTEVEVDGSDAELRPLDFHQVLKDGQSCTDILGIFDHEASLEFETAGVATVRVVGVEEPAGTAVEITSGVVVR